MTVPSEEPTEPTIENPEALPVPYLLELVLNDDRTAYNNVQGGSEVISHNGGKQVALEEAIGMKAVSFAGKAAVYNMDLSDLYSDLRETFTMEVYFLMSAKPSSPAQCGIVDNQEAGGFRLMMKLREDGSAYALWSQYLDGAYKLIEYESEWAFFNFTEIDAARYLAIGAECSAGNHGGNGMVGKLAICNIYSDALTAAQVAAIYQNLPINAV